MHAPDARLIEPKPDPVAVIVAAGRGTRLLPLTATRPKCLVPVGGRAILDHQLDALAAAGIGRAVVVAGYRADQVATHVAGARHPLAASVLFNPFWAVASSISSVWAARACFEGPFLLLNGDTVFDASVIRDALARAGDGVELVVERVARFAPDDMRVAARDGRVVAVAKMLDAAVATHRSLGLIVSRGPHGGGYGAALREVIDAPEGIHAFHHAIVDRLARTSRVGALEAAGRWCEIDRPEDIAGWSLSHPGLVQIDRDGNVPPAARAVRASVDRRGASR